MKNRHRKARQSRGYLDTLALRGEHLASYLTRRNKPAQVSLERIMNFVEKAQNYQHTRIKNGKSYVEKSPSHVEKQERQREKCIARLWECYNQVLETEVMHPTKKGKDETWNGAKEVNGTWTSEPIYYYGDHLEYVLGDELHGYTAQGRTKVKNLDSYENKEDEG